MAPRGRPILIGIPMCRQKSVQRHQKLVDSLTSWRSNQIRIDTQTGSHGGTQPDSVPPSAPPRQTATWENLSVRVSRPLAEAIFAICPGQFPPGHPVRPLRIALAMSVKSMTPGLSSNSFRKVFHAAEGFLARPKTGHNFHEEAATVDAAP